MIFNEYERLLSRNSEGGGLSVPSIAAWRFLFDCQNAFAIKGDMLEIGIFHGAGLAAMRMHASETETVQGIDIRLQQNEIDETLKRVLGGGAGIILHCRNSIDIRKESGLGGAGFRFIHIDGEHSYDAVRSDLELAERLLCDGGIIAVDDFFNINSACVTQAVFDALAARPFAFRMFLAGFNKAYLSTPRFFAKYRGEVLNRFVDFAEREFGEKALLAKQGHGTEIDYITFSGRRANYKGMQIGEWLNEPPQL